MNEKAVVVFLSGERWLRFHLRMPMSVQRMTVITNTSTAPKHTAPTNNEAVLFAQRFDGIFCFLQTTAHLFSVELDCWNFLPCTEQPHNFAFKALWYFPVRMCEVLLRLERLYGRFLGYTPSPPLFPLDTT